MNSISFLGCECDRCNRLRSENPSSLPLSGNCCKTSRFAAKCGLIDIPIPIFEQFILPYLIGHNILYLTMTSRGFRDYFSDQDLWKNIYIREKVGIFHHEKIRKLAESKIGRSNKSSHLTLEEQNQNKCTMVIENNTKDIPFDIYWVRKYNISQICKMDEIKLKGKVLPGEKFVISTHPNHKWFCIPIFAWLLNNPVSNLGFSFLVDIFNLQTYQFKKTSKLAYVRKIYEPKQLNPIKGIDSPYKNYKHQVMKLKIIPNNLNNLIQANTNQYEYALRKLRHMKKQVRYMESGILKNKQRGEMLSHTKKIIS